MKHLLFAASACLLVPAAYAQTSQFTPPAPAPEWDKSFTVAGDAVGTGPTALQFEETTQSFSWSDTGRWQMDFNMTSRVQESPYPREEMEAGASYKFTPRFSVGGSLMVGANELNDVSQWEEQRVEAGVRLKSSFRF